MATFAERLRELREAKGQSQAAMDEYFDLMRGTIANWEHGFASPEQELIEPIAQYFHVSEAYLRGKDADK